MSQNATAANPLAQATFLLSVARLGQLPADTTAEVAFVGRSNAGKSSALNALCGQKSLARVSKTPGRTQMINLFSLPGGARVVDLPGYGYAAVPEPVRRSWQALAGGYVERRENLGGLVLLMDVRHPLRPLDRQLLALAERRRLPVLALLTKADKLSRNAQAAALRAVRAELLAAQSELFSATSGLGVGLARDWVAARLGLQSPQAASVSRPD